VLFVPYHYGEYGSLCASAKGEYVALIEPVEPEGPTSLDWTPNPEPNPVWLSASVAAESLAQAKADSETEGTWILLEGEVNELWKQFYELAGDLDPALDPAGYTPGGDDDTYDYYPTHFEVLAAWAQDLDAIIEKETVHQKERMEGNPRGYFAMAKWFTARRRVEEIAAHLYSLPGGAEQVDYMEMTEMLAPFTGLVPEGVK
jgi:hypothetical protein